KEYLFRLYFVDAPETDEMTPGRLVQQAKYFGITVPQAIEVGRRAKEFVDEKLATPFTIFTHMSDAIGQSRLERFYAFVQTKDAVWQDRHQHCDGKRADNRPRDRARDSGPHHRSPTVPQC